MRASRIIAISRPSFIFCLLLGMIMGIAGFNNLNLYTLVTLAIFTLPLNYYLYGLNDYFDRASDELNPRKGGYQGAIINDTEAAFLKKTVGIPPIIAIFWAVLSFNTEHIFWVALFVVACFVYSHKWFRFKGVPFLDTLTSALVYLTPIMVMWSLHSTVFEINPYLLLLVIPAMGVHAITTITDRSYDKIAKINTSAVFLGERITLLYAALTIGLPIYFLTDYKFIVTVLLYGSLLAFVSFFAHYSKEKKSIIRPSGFLYMSLWGILLLYGILSFYAY